MFLAIVAVATVAHPIANEMGDNLRSEERIREDARLYDTLQKEAQDALQEAKSDGKEAMTAATKLASLLKPDVGNPKYAEEESAYQENKVKARKSAKKVKVALEDAQLATRLDAISILTGPFSNHNVRLVR